VIDWLNKIINESILGSAIVRVLNSKDLENKKFASANQKAAELGIEQVNIFATTFPVIGFIANGASLIILLLGGHFIITGEMTVGNFTAFVAYLGLIVFPLIMIGFLSSSISSAAASYARISGTLNSEDKKDTGTVKAQLSGDIEIENVNVNFGEKSILKNINLKVKAGSRTAILGPTAAGKTHLMYLLIGILAPNTGVVKYDGRDIGTYDSESLHEQVGLVFQDSIMFNLSLRENIAFNKKVTEADIKKALDTAELSEFVESLPGGLDAMVMERGTSLSGGQKQRIMLARALALNPKVLLLDDFTARVDNTTEHKILKNVRTNYPDVTLVSVTQKISSIEDFDQIIVLMEGEILATGTHKELMAKSTEYVQIFDSQKSTNHYELQT
jgi:ATP-binding cassette subfamily B protein